MAISVVQTVYGSANSGTTTALSFATTPAAGDLIVVLVNDYATTPAAGAVTDNQGNTYTRDVLVGDPTLNNAAIYSCPNVASTGTFTVTYTSGNTVGRNVGILDVSGAARSAPLDVTATNTGTATSGTSGTTGTTAQADELVVATTCNADTTMPASATVGYTNVGKNNGGAFLAGSADYKVVSATGTQSASWAFSGSARFDACIATYKAAAVAPPSIFRPNVHSQAVKRAAFW